MSEFCVHFWECSENIFKSNKFQILLENFSHPLKIILNRRKNLIWKIFQARTRHSNLIIINFFAI